MSTPPNIVFIVADDLGYADLGCYGGRGFDGAGAHSISPELDRLASQGIRFTQGYANSPVCSPTRFAMMTARYQYHLRGAADEPIASKARGSKTLGLPPEHPTLPSLLRGAGYATALVGKWHLGFPPVFGPLKSGFDEFFGPLSGGVDYFTHCDSKGVHDLWASEKGEVKELHEIGYLTDLMTERGLDFIQRSVGSAQPKPFYLSLCYTAPHWPWETRDDAALASEIKDNIFHLHGGNIHTYRKMVHHMDEGIGRMVRLLESLGQLVNTLIVFTSDNGGERFSDNWPLVGGKMDLTEGGIRVPYIAQWPRTIAPGQVSAQPCLTMDWSATILEAAGVQAHADYPLDGVSLLPQLRGSEESSEKGSEEGSERSLFWRMKHREQRAMRQGRYKYLRVEGMDYLFDLSQDERERANLGAHQPQRLNAMRSAWEAWNATMPTIPDDALVSLGYGRADMPQR